MAHANARLNLHGRRLLVERVIDDGRPVAHVAKELGVSRQCAHRWVARFRAEGEAGLRDRSSRPHRCPRRTPAEVEQQVLQLRRAERRGQDWIGPELGLAGPDRLGDPAPPPGALPARVRPADRGGHPGIARPPRSATNTTTPAPGPHGRQEGRPDPRRRRLEGPRPRARSDRRQKHARIGFDYVHSLVDDHSRLAYSEVLPDEKGTDLRRRSCSAPPPTSPATASPDRAR